MAYDISETRYGSTNHILIALLFRNGLAQRAPSSILISEL